MVYGEFILGFLLLGGVKHVITLKPRSAEETLIYIPPRNFLQGF